MTRFLFLLLIMITTCCWSACSCKTEASGVVLDAKTLQPLAGVQIELELATVHGDTLEQPVFTNAAGKYELVHFYCKNHSLVFIKDNYVAYTVSAQLKDTIYLNRLEDME